MVMEQQNLFPNVPNLLESFKLFRHHLETKLILREKVEKLRIARLAARQNAIVQFGNSEGESK
jgi:hypothetical protein